MWKQIQPQIVLEKGEDIAVIDREAALKLLEQKDPAKRQLGQRALERIGPEAADLILKRLQQEATKRKKRRRIMIWVAGTYGTLFGGWALIWLAAGLYTGHWGRFPWQAFQFVNMFSIFAGATALSQFQKGAMAVAAKLDDTRYVPYLIDSLASSDKSLHELAVPALTNLLPKLTASDSELLDTEHHQTLHRGLM